MKVLAALYILIIGVIIYGANTGRLGPVAEMIRKVPYGDAVMHAILMGLLAVAANHLLRFRIIQVGKWPLLLGSVLVVLFVIVEEATQLFIANRTFSWIDLGADFFGIWLFGHLGTRKDK